MGKDLKGKNLGRGFSQKKDGRYIYRIMVNGERFELVNESLTKLRKEVRRAPLSESKPKNGTFNEWYQKWLEDYKLPMLKNKTTRVNYERRLRRNFQDDLGHKRISRIQPKDILQSVNRLKECGYSPMTIRENYGLVKNFFEELTKQGIINRNPCDGLKPNFGMKEPTEERVLSVEEEREFLNEVKGSRFEDVFYVLAMTGMRIGEISGLKIQDIDFKNKVIHIRRQLLYTPYKGQARYEFGPPKSQKGYREIPFIDDVESHLRHQLSVRPEHVKEKRFEDLVFYSRDGTPINRQSLFTVLNRRVARINKKRKQEQGDDYEVFERIHLHTFRHTFCTRLFEKNVNPVVVQRIMGHENYTTTLQYTHTNEALVENELKKVRNLI